MATMRCLVRFRPSDREAVRFGHVDRGELGRVTGPLGGAPALRAQRWRADGEQTH
jgi:hypothetical protein